MNNNTERTKLLEKSIQNILNNNFDEDSKVLFATILKILENIIQKPNNDKVRSIRLSNKAFSTKVGDKKGGIDFLISCGFTLQRPTPQLLSPSSTTSSNKNENSSLTLLPENENTNHLLKARQLITTTCIHELHMSLDDLPKQSQPPPQTQSQPTSSANNRGNVSNNFDVYKGHKFDAKSAAVGTNLGPDSNYVSTTETQLRKLQEKQRKLEDKMHHKDQTFDRQIIATYNNRNINAVSSTTGGSNTGAVGGSGGGGDGSLLAQHMKKQQEERLKREEGGFTTKAMRDLEKIKKMKVYSHVSLRISMPDNQVIISANFKPKETISVVKNVLKRDCFINLGGDNNKNIDFDLYVSPPRKLLDPKKSLYDEGLVPAAKIFLSWKVNKKPSTTSYILPELFMDNKNDTSIASNSGDGATTMPPSSYPTAKSIVSSSSNLQSFQQENKSTTNNNEDGNGTNSREEEMLRRMMGGKKGGLGFGLGGKKKKRNI